ncbi:MAG: hypothetical protein P8Y44_05195 [Acidobacteriota bacterium]
MTIDTSYRGSPSIQAQGRIRSRTLFTLARGLSTALALMVVVAGGSATETLASELPCLPCVGVRTDDPALLLPGLSQPRTLSPQAPLYVAWPVALDGTVTNETAQAVSESGSVPWLDLRFTTPSPLFQNIDQLELELEVAARVASRAGPTARFQISWQPPEPVAADLWAKDYAFLLKRAAVAVTGAQARAQVITAALAADPELVTRLYSEEVAAYVDGVALASETLPELQATLEVLRDLDPGKPIVLDSLPFPEHPETVLAQAAEMAVEGLALTLFEIGPEQAPDLSALKIMAEEFAGDLSYDPYSTPVGAEGIRAWSFVRGEDLGLRVIVEGSPAEQAVEVEFSDSQLRSPERVDLTSGKILDMFGSRTGQGLTLRWEAQAPVTLLRLSRLTAEEIEGIEGLEEELTVTTERQLPVEEILRRMQAVEDAQRRKVATYQALNTTHLRFQVGTQGIEVTFQGEIFFKQGEPYDWAWQDLYLNGLRWRGKRLPELPLIEPRRAANLPLEILFNKDYSYRLRGTAEMDGRDCWVVDFQPHVEESEESLFRGTVWIDRELFVRVRSKAVQLGLTGEVISNEETIIYTPFDTTGEPAEAATDRIWLPSRVVSQQVWSLFNTATVVEKEMELTGIAINSDSFEQRRRAIMDSDVTMVRETDQGLRYLVPDKETGERVVKWKNDPNRLFFAGGVFYDESFAYPLPLAGVDFFSLDFKGTGAQVNALFAGVLLIANIADPTFLGTEFDAGADLFLVAPKFSNTVYKNDQEIFGEELLERPASLSLNLGRKLGSYFKLNGTYNISYVDFSPSDNTAENFVVPVDHFTHTLGLEAALNRNGYRLRLGGSASSRSQWEPWGTEDSNDFDPDDKNFYRWGASIAKTFHLGGFKKAGFELRYVDGKNLDRFSKYEFGFFSDVFIHGYQMERIRAEQAWVFNTSYGFEFSELFRLQFIADGG